MGRTCCVECQGDGGLGIKRCQAPGILWGEWDRGMQQQE